MIGNLYAVSAATGSLLWSFTTGGPVLGSPAVIDGVVYFGSPGDAVVVTASVVVVVSTSVVVMETASASVVVVVSDVGTVVPALSTPSPSPPQEEGSTRSTRLGHSDAPARALLDGLLSKRKPLHPSASRGE